jgi:hypothetical protein
VWSRQFSIFNWVWRSALGLMLAGGFVLLASPVFAQTVSPQKAQPGNEETKPKTVQAQQSNGPPASAPVAPVNSAVVVPTGSPKLQPQKNCVKKNEFADELKSGIRPVGDAIAFGTNFLPTNQRVDVGVRTPFVKGRRYFAALGYEDGDSYLLKRQDVVTRAASESDVLVKKRSLEEDQTIVTLNMGDDFAWFWTRVDLYLYVCDDAVSESPFQVSVASVRLSPYWLSLGITAGSIFLLYLLVAFEFRRRGGGTISFVRGLNPAKLSAGLDGKGSLSTFQTLSFSLVVFGLILFFFLQTGMLSDLSGTILVLLGISGVGSTIAKNSDTQRNAISPENRVWLFQRSWIPAVTLSARDPSNASWRDFFTTDDVFDVYRYQSFIFGLVVVGALVASGVTQLSTFAIPDTILGIVGLSQLVYIGGKITGTTNMSDLNGVISDLRDQEKKLRDAVVSRAGPGANVNLQAAVTDAERPAYDSYKSNARGVASLLQELTGVVVPDAELEPR